MTTVTVEQVHDACRTILKDSSNISPSHRYAASYADAMLNDIQPDDTSAVYVQCLYILNNLTHWRHPQASHVRQTLRDYIKENAPR